MEKPRLEMLKEVGAGRALTLAATSLILYSAMMLAVLTATQPADTGAAIATFVTPAAQAAEANAPATQSREHGGERTVYFPASFPPVTGEIAAPIEQF